MKQMKNSGIEWIGKIPSQWAVLRNKYNFDLNKNIVGTAYKDTQLLSLTKNGIKAISEDDQKGKVPTSFATYQTVDENDIVMCLFDLDVSAVFSGISPYEGMISPAYKCFKCKEHLFPQYVDYYFRTVFVDRKYKRYSKNVRYSISADEFMALPILVPPFEVQKAIANFLDQKCSEIDSLSSDIQSQIDVLEEYKKSVITEAVTKGLNPDVKMKDSGIEAIGKISKDFECKRIKQCTIGMTDGTHGTFQRTNDGQMLLSAKNVFEDGLHIGELESLISEADYKLIVKNGYPKKNDVLLCCVGTVGRCMIYEEDHPIAFQRSVLFLRCDNKIILPKMLFYCLQSIPTLTQEKMAITKSAQDGLYQGAVSELRITFPQDIDMQYKIVHYLDIKCAEIDAVITDKKAQLETLAEYKKSLIYEYVTGKKEVKINE